MARTDYSKFNDNFINNLSEDELRMYIRKTSDAINKRLSRESKTSMGDENLDKLYKVIRQGSEFTIKYREAAISGVQEGFVKPEYGKIRKLRTTVKNITDIEKLRDILRQNVSILNTQTVKQYFKTMVKESGLTLEEFGKLSPESFKDEKAVRIAKEHYYDSLESMDGEEAVEESDTIKDLGQRMREGDIDAARELLKRGLISIDSFLEMMRKLE